MRSGFLLDRAVSLFNGQRNVEFFNRFIDVCNNNRLMSTGDNAAGLFQHLSGFFELFIRDGLFFMAMTIAADVRPQLVARRFNGVHRFDAVPFIIVVRGGHGFVRVAKQTNFSGFPCRFRGLQAGKHARQQERCRDGLNHSNIALYYVSSRLDFSDTPIVPTGTTRGRTVGFT